MTSRLVSAAVSLVLMLAFGAPLDIVQATQQSPPAQGTSQPRPGMQEMMKMHEQMMAEMKAGDAKLDALVKDMNAATGEAKVTALAAAVNELVRQHKAMHSHMGQMHQQMMGGRGMMMRQ